MSSLGSVGYKVVVMGQARKLDKKNLNDLNESVKCVNLKMYSNIGKTIFCIFIQKAVANQ